VVLVYIAEAHAADEWPINSTRCAGPANSIRRHRSLDERCAVARAAAAALGLEALPMLVDGMGDGFLEGFAAWPIRLYGVGRGGATVERIAQPSDAAFSLPPLRDWLLANCCKES